MDCYYTFKGHSPIFGFSDFVFLNLVHCVIHNSVWVLRKMHVNSNCLNSSQLVSLMETMLYFKLVFPVYHAQTTPETL